MRFVCAFAVASACLSGAAGASSEDIPPLPPQTGFHWQSRLDEWERYSRDVLLARFPARKKLVRKIRIHIANNDAFAFIGGDRRKIFLTTGVIRFVRDEHEYASLLSHEFGHQLISHQLLAFPPRISDEGLFFAVRVDGTTSFPWLLYRTQELEADFVNMLTARDGSVPLLLAERASRARRADPRNEREDEQGNRLAQTEALRIQTMRNILGSATLAPLAAARPLPKRLPKWNAGEEAWGAFGHEVLRAMYPDHVAVADRTLITINESCDSGRARRLESQDETVRLDAIELNVDFIKEIARSPKEFAAMIGHEFGHLLTWRDYALDHLNTDVSFTDFELWERQQFEADLIGTLPLPKGECIWAKLLERMERSTVLPPIDSPEVERAERERLARFRAMCALNY